MARSRLQSKRKAKNGAGDSVTVYFDQSDPAERRALEASRLLAAKHGRRKQVIVTLLEAIYLHYEQTGELMSSAQLATRVSGFQAETRPERNLTPQLPAGDIAPRDRLSAHKASGAIVEFASDSSAALTSAQNLLNGFKSSFFD